MAQSVYVYHAISTQINYTNKMGIKYKNINISYIYNPLQAIKWDIN